MSETVAPFAGRYRELRVLGEGAFGAVTLCEDLELGRTVALKRLHARRSEPEVLARFRREGQAAGKVTHPGVVQVFDAGTTPEGVHYIASEYVEGVSLEELLADGRPRPPQEVMAWLRELAAALAAIHGAGVVHRDLKPGNVMRAEDRLKICDFGLARIDDERTVLTGTGRIVGTPLYLAPELLRGTHGPGPAADVWALGALGYLLATGRPWRDGSDLGAMIAVEVRGTQGLRARLEEVPAAPVRRLLELLLAPSPEARPADGAAALALFDEGERPQARDSRGAPLPALGPAAPGRRGALAIGVLLVACVGLGLMVGDQAPGRPGEAAPMRDPEALHSPAAEAGPTAREATRRLGAARRALRLGADDLLDDLPTVEARDAAMLEAVADNGLLRRYRTLVEAVDARAEPAELGLAARVLSRAGNRARIVEGWLRKAKLEQAIGREPGPHDEGAWANVTGLSGAARDGLDRIWREESPAPGPELLWVSLALLSLDREGDHPRDMLRRVAPRVGAAIPTSPGPLGLELARELSRMMRDDFAVRMLPSALRHRMLGDLARELELPPERWRDEEYRKVLGILIEVAALHLRWDRVEPNPALVEAFDRLVDTLEALDGDHPQRLHDVLEGAWNQITDSELLAGEPGPVYRERRARIVALAGRGP